MGFQKLFWVFLTCIFVALFFTVVRSGYYYQIDIDELYHSQLVYLLNHGHAIYTSFYTPYTPVFYWILRPFFHILGYGIDVLMWARVLMIGFFLLRLLCIFLIVRSLVSWKAGLLSVFLLILDPFAVMSAMQIRPDTIMLLFFTVGIYTYIHARRQNRKELFFLSGVLLAGSALTLFKILPSLLAFFVVALVSSVKRKTVSLEAMTFLGMLLTLSLVFGIFMVSGQLNGVIQQTMIDPFTVFSVLLYPVYFGFYLKEGNMWIYGPWNRPIAWVYAQLLLPLGGFGIYSLLEKIKDRSINPILRDTLLILFFSLVLQWLWLLTVPSIFLQYYLPVNWIIAVLAGIGIYTLLKKTSEKFVKLCEFGGVFLFFAIFTYGSIQTNMFRQNIRSTDMINRILSLWNAIPENSAVFPSVLFRPIVYPPMPYQIYANELPATVVNRYPAVRDLLEQKQVRYVYNHTGIIASLPEEDQEYIRSKFVPGGIDDEVFVRK